jgi:hypothetical protein
VTGRADIRIRRTTTGCVALLALFAGTVSYLHMHRLVALHGQPGWVAALTPLSVDGMIVAASTTLLAWPSFALTASYELLTRQVRRGAARQDAHNQQLPEPQPSPAGSERGPAPGLRVVGPSRAGRGDRRTNGELRRQAWRWALAHRYEDGALPSGRAIVRAHGRQERWGRLVKNAGLAGAFGPGRPASASSKLARPPVNGSAFRSINRSSFPAAGDRMGRTRSGRHGGAAGAATPASGCRGGAMSRAAPVAEGVPGGLEARGGIAGAGGPGRVGERLHRQQPVPVDGQVAPGEPAQGPSQHRGGQVRYPAALDADITSALRASRYRPWVQVS